MTETLFDKVRMYVQEHPDATAQEIQREVGCCFNTASAYFRIIGQGFASPQEYYNSLGRREIPQTQALTGKKKKKYKADLEYKLSSLIVSRLGELGQEQKWLAEQIGVDKSSVTFYIQGKRFPYVQTCERIFSALDVPYKTIDDLMEQYNEERK